MGGRSGRAIVLVHNSLGPGPPPPLLLSSLLMSACPPERACVSRGAVRVPLHCHDTALPSGHGGAKGDLGGATRVAVCRA